MRRAGGMLAATILAMGLSACSKPSAAVQIESARAQLSPIAGGSGAVYLTIRNTTPVADRLVSVDATVAKHVELHEVVKEGEMMRMVPHPEGFVVPAGGSVELTPGGKHIMLFDALSADEAGANVKLTLHFEKAGALAVSAPVAKNGS